MSIREKIAATAGDKFKEEASPFGPAKAAFEKMKFDVSVTENELVAKHKTNDKIVVTMKLVNRKDEDDPLYVTEMNVSLLDPPGGDRYYIKARGEGKNSSASFDAWYEEAVKAFSDTKKAWAKAVNGQIGRQYYWLSGFYAGRMKKGKKKK